LLECNLGLLGVIAILLGGKNPDDLGIGQRGPLVHIFLRDSVVLGLLCFADRFLLRPELCRPCTVLPLHRVGPSVVALGFGKELSSHRKCRRRPPPFIERDHGFDRSPHHKLAMAVYDSRLASWEMDYPCHHVPLNFCTCGVVPVVCWATIVKRWFDSRLQRKEREIGGVLVVKR
jgi:hypothetical protein